jgi:hypothetical protein
MVGISGETKCIREYETRFTGITWAGIASRIPGHAKCATPENLPRDIPVEKW